MRCPCPAFPGPAPCKPRKPQRKKRQRRVRSNKGSAFRSRYRESLDPGTNVPVLVGTLTSWRYGVDNYFSNPRPWYDPTGQSGRRMWDELHPPLQKRPSMWRISATGVHANPENADFGGPMRSIRAYSPWHVVKGNTVVKDGDPGFVVEYSGGFVPTWFGNHPSPPGFDWAWNSASSDNYGDAEQFGADGFDKFRPRLQGVDTAAVLYENIGDFAGQLHTSATGFKDLYRGLGGGDGGGLGFFNPQSLSNHFLNHVFGWAPFVGDITKLLHAAKNVHNVLSRHKRENGRWIHRRGTVSRSLSSITELFSDHYAYVYPDISGLTRWDLAPDGVSTRGYSVFHHEVEQVVTFSGEFRYWVPDLVHDEYSRLAHIANLLTYGGLRVNPATIWKLTPWTWLSDWFGNYGQVYRNILAGTPDDCVARYAYVMADTVKRTRHFATVHLIDGRNSESAWTQLIEVKSRAKASPFGFGLTRDDLSARQLAILGALGISRYF